MEETYFFGNFTHTLDAQRRISVPALWRPKNEPMDFFLVPAADGLLHLMLIGAMKRFLENVSKVSINDSEKRKRIAFYTSRIQQCKMDKQGRLALPAMIKEYAGIEEQVVLVGGGDSIQLWNPRRWEEELAAQGNGDAFNETVKEIGGWN